MSETAINLLPSLQNLYETLKSNPEDVTFCDLYKEFAEVYRRLNAGVILPQSLQNYVGLTHREVLNRLNEDKKVLGKRFVAAYDKLLMQIHGEAPKVSEDERYDMEWRIKKFPEENQAIKDEMNKIISREFVENYNKHLNCELGGWIDAVERYMHEMSEMVNKHLDKIIELGEGDKTHLEMVSNHNRELHVFDEKVKAFMQETFLSEDQTVREDIAMSIKAKELYEDVTWINGYIVKNEMMLCSTNFERLNEYVNVYFSVEELLDYQIDIFTKNYEDFLRQLYKHGYSSRKDGGTVFNFLATAHLDMFERYESDYPMHHRSREYVVDMAQKVNELQRLISFLRSENLLGEGFVKLQKNIPYTVCFINFFFKIK